MLSTVSVHSFPPFLHHRVGLRYEPCLASGASPVTQFLTPLSLPLAPSCPRRCRVTYPCTPVFFGPLVWGAEVGTRCLSA
uniref:Uncharacterized protein n=1 Tax=Leishmania guyanensis TaxID=5670 RepID=A0A1E1J965_LEIGU|nr:Hypothetical protein BN36_NA76450 [Leishmania guyanensis]CCM43472.1 Hypothetical protein BN36_NA76790 [Leishmania guyanensis]